MSKVDASMKNKFPLSLKRRVLHSMLKGHSAGALSKEAKRELLNRLLVVLEQSPVHKALLYRVCSVYQQKLSRKAIPTSASSSAPMH
jgi:hypothetical protein